MEHKFWLDRQREAVALAHGATSSEARLIHLELAGRYGIEALRFDRQATAGPASPSPVAETPREIPLRAVHLPPHSRDPQEKPERKLAMSELTELRAQIERMEGKSSERAADGHFWGRPGFSVHHSSELHRAKDRLTVLRGGASG